MKTLFNRNLSNTPHLTYYELAIIFVIPLLYKLMTFLSSTCDIPLISTTLLANSPSPLFARGDKVATILLGVRSEDNTHDYQVI